MQNFINEIIGFIVSILTAFRNYWQGQSQSDLDKYYNWYASDIFNDGGLISINLTWEQLLKYVLPLILVILIIVLFIKFIFKIVGLFRL